MAQPSAVYGRELSFVTDNDVLLVTDYYYTAGQELTFRKLINSKNFLKKTDSCKLFGFLGYGFKMFTPKSIRFSDVGRMDRPYAGWSYLRGGLTRYKNKWTTESFGLEAGLIGEQSGIGRFQVWWHDKFNLPTPRGWASQIANEVVFNFNYQFMRQFKLDNGIDFISQSDVYGGTGTNRLAQQFIIRAGDLNPLNQSVFTNGRLGSDDVPHESEFFIFIGYEMNYVISNIFIEGSLFNHNPSTLTGKAIPFVTRNVYGLMHSNKRSSFQFSFSFLSKEVEGNKKHGFTTIVYSYRF